LLLLACSTANAAEKYDADLPEILEDAKYSFNRWNELAISAMCGELPEDLAATCRQEISVIGRNVAAARPILSRASRSKTPATIDLFDIYADLQEIAGNLNSMADNIANFTRSESGAEYARAGGKTLLLSTRLGNIIRARVEDGNCGHSQQDSNKRLSK
jgi:hypothetical protein